MTAYDITISLEGVGSTDDVGARLFDALARQGIEAVIEHDTVGERVEIDVVMASRDLPRAVEAMVTATRAACHAAGLARAEICTLAAAPAAVGADSAA